MLKGLSGLLVFLALAPSLPALGNSDDLHSVAAQIIDAGKSARILALGTSYYTPLTYQLLTRILALEIHDVDFIALEISAENQPELDQMVTQEQGELTRFGQYDASDSRLAAVNQLVNLIRSENKRRLAEGEEILRLLALDDPGTRYSTLAEWYLNRDRTMYETLILETGLKKKGILMMGTAHLGPNPAALPKILRRTQKLPNGEPLPEKIQTIGNWLSLDPRTSNQVINVYVDVPRTLFMDFTYLPPENWNLRKIARALPRHELVARRELVPLDLKYPGAISISGNYDYFVGIGTEPEDSSRCSDWLSRKALAGLFLQLYGR